MNPSARTLSRTLTALATAALLTLAACGGGGSGLEIGSSTKSGGAAGSGNPSPVPTLSELVAVPGATIESMRWITDKRVLELTIRSDAFVAPVKVEVLLPAGYYTDTQRRWATTYYLGGTNHNQTTFRVDYGAQDLIESFPSIVVGPSGEAGYWSDWYNNGAGGPPKYETFVIRQLTPLIDANFRTVGDRAHRAVMGESMGGFGALMLAARHPDVYAAAASLSGTVDINYPTGMAAVSASPPLQMGQPDAIYGPHLTQEVRWRGHNPWDLARNLGGLDLLVITGNGMAGASSEETAAETSAGCPLEAGAILPESTNLHDQLTALGIPHAWEPLPWGCHSRALFRYEIGRAVARFQKVFADAPAPPARFDFRAVEPAWSVYGWTVAADAGRALEFMDLRDAGSGGFTLIGSGTTRVTTPGFFRGRSTVDVSVDGVTTAVQPDASGRLSFPVNLGTANTQQAYAPGSVNPAATRRVTFTPR